MTIHYIVPTMLHVDLVEAYYVDDVLFKQYIMVDYFIRDGLLK